MHWWKILPNQLRLSKFSVSAPKIFFNFFSGNEKSMVLPTEDSHQRRRFCYLFFVSPTPPDRPSSFDWWTSGSENSSSISHCCQSKYIFQVLVRGLKRTQPFTVCFIFFQSRSSSVTLYYKWQYHWYQVYMTVLRQFVCSSSLLHSWVSLVIFDLTIKGLWTSETRWAYFEMCSFWDCFSREGYRWQSKNLQ